MKSIIKKMLYTISEDWGTPAYKELYNEIDKYEKERNILDTIIKKRVNLYYVDMASDVELYNEWMVVLYGYSKEFLLTQEEFDSIRFNTTIRGEM